MTNKQKIGALIIILFTIISLGIVGRWDQQYQTNGTESVFTVQQ